MLALAATCAPTAAPTQPVTALEASGTANSDGLFLYDRHVQKTGGVTLRNIMIGSSEQGECLYWGYWQTKDRWDRVLDLLKKDPAQRRSRLCIEAHFVDDAHANSNSRSE